jgi:hypothetical protein
LVLWVGERVKESITQGKVRMGGHVKNAPIPNQDPSSHDRAFGFGPPKIKRKKQNKTKVSPPRKKKIGNIY